MTKISNHIYQIIKEQPYADPFTNDFDSSRLLKEFGDLLNEDETNLLQFLHICNELFQDLKRNIFSLFDKIKLSPEDLREFLYIAINKYFLDLTPPLIKEISAGSYQESENIIFSKFTIANEQKINAQLVIEIGGDILAELISFSTQWKTDENGNDLLQNLDPEKHGNLFQNLWVYTNIFLNLKNLAYNIVKYENGKVIFRDAKEIKIENGLNATLFLKNAGIIRANNSIQEFFLSGMKFYEKVFEKRFGVSGFDINGNVLSPQKGKVDLTIKAKADSSLLVFYPHFTDVKLDYFDGLNLFDLLDLLVLIEECIEKLNHKNVYEYSERQLNEIPIKFNANELVNFLSESTGHKHETVDKFISSITSNNHHPYFWREPFIKEGNFLLFSLAATISPNHVLFFDKWTTLSGYSLESKEKMFRAFVLKDLVISHKIKYEFKIIELDKLRINNEIFKNSILIETASLLVLLEIKLFDFPIESSEVDSALLRLGNATFDIEEKAKQLIGIFDGKKELNKIIITNYTIFSGLQINNIPIVDLTLFNNYVFTGNLRKVNVTFHEGKPILNDSGIISYYNNEDEFNSNFKKFFADPLPVKQILERLYLKEQQITPVFVMPKFFVDTIDHITDDELMNSRIDNLSELLNYEYFCEPVDKVGKDLLNESIIYSLSEIFSKLSNSPYESYKTRIELYHSISKIKLLGFVHLSFYILKTLERLNGGKIKMTQRFESVEYDTDEILELLEKAKNDLAGPIRLSEYEIEDCTFTDREERKIISFSIDLLSGLNTYIFFETSLDSFFLPLALLNVFSKKHNVDFEFYTACSNMIDALNSIHKYQTARDFCEELLILSINNNKHSYGWHIMFKCYTIQKSNFDASINGCLFLASVSILPEIPEFLAFECLNGALKFFRNFRLTEFAKYCFENLQVFNLNEYDKQRVTLSYFYTFFNEEISKDSEIFDQAMDYVENKINDIIGFKEHGVIPWLLFLYNIERLQSLKQITYNRDFKKYIDKFEKSISEKNVNEIRSKIFGDKERLKEQFISALLNTFETRSISDFVNESQHLSLIASNFLQSAIISEDIEGILLTGLIINDQSSTFKNISLPYGSTLPVSKPINEELKLQLNNYKYYLLSKINLTTKQILIWLFEDLGKVYFVSLNSNKEFRFVTLGNWSFRKMNSLLKAIGDFHFNSKKGQFNNPRKVHPYDYEVQKEDYDNLNIEMRFTNLDISTNIDELLICNSIELASFPHNLIQNNNEFISASIPICNVISIERFLDKSNPFYLNKNYSISAWIPSDDQEPIISWGFNLLIPTLKKINAAIFTSTYPEVIIKSDLNIFLAHGVRDGSGFKAVYTNRTENKVIVFPYEVFGDGEIAILFVCNSGSSHEEFFSNSVVSFSGELLKSGYQSVVAPFWSFDVTMSKIWLDEFLDTFNQGFSINEAVWLANKRLSLYDSETSNIFYAPAGCFAMHLYGNPNVYVKS